MDLSSSYPFPLLEKGMLQTYPALTKDIKADIVVLGAGITGALVAWKLVEAGYDVTILDKRHPGMGSTAACTSLLQYEIDVPLHSLIELVGKEKAEKSYLLCKQSLDDIEEITNKLKRDLGFERKQSLQWASKPSHAAKLEKEYELRKAIGIELKLLDKNQLEKGYGFSAAAALVSKDAAYVDTYFLTHAIFEYLQKKGARLYDRIEVTAIEETGKKMQLLGRDGRRINCRKLVVACGYESLKFIPHPIAKLHSTFVILTKPIDAPPKWMRHTMLWETSDPYLYMRPTPDGRLLAGGRDEPFFNPGKRDAKLYTKARSLEKAVQKIFPTLQFHTDFEWAGTFGKTKDGLPYFGQIAQYRNAHFVLGFGGNGVSFSMIGARFLTEKLSGRKNDDHSIFSFDR